MNTTTEEKISVGVNVPTSELAEMRRVTCVDLSGPAVLALARKGLAAELDKIAYKKACADMSEKSSDNDLTGIVCPICHGKNGVIQVSRFGCTFKCVDCKIVMDRCDKDIYSGTEFETFLSDLTTKCAKQRRGR